MFLEGAQHRKVLVQWVKTAQPGSQVDLISPWVSKESLYRLLKARKTGVKVHLITRYPRSIDEVNFTDWAALKNAEKTYSDFRLSIVEESGSLHAKVYRVEGKGAIITSANMTESGMPMDSHGNTEAGMKVQDEATLADLDEWIGNLSVQPLSTKWFDYLEIQQKKYDEWYKKARNKAGPSPGLLLKPDLGSDLAADVIRGLIERGEIRDASRLDGYGVRAFELDFSDKRPRYRVKVVHSQINHGKVSGVDTEYHFELQVDVLKDWKKKNDPIHGVIFLPYGVDGQGKNVLLSDPSPAFLPFSVLFGKDGFCLGKLIKGRSDRTPTIYLSKREGEEEWGLRYRNQVVMKKRKGWLGEVRLMKRSKMLP